MRAFSLLCVCGGLFDTVGVRCHTRGVVVYTIVPRGRGYWIIANGNNGVRRPIERFDTEDTAVRRLRELQKQTDAIDRKNIVLLPKKDL